MGPSDRPVGEPADRSPRLVTIAMVVATALVIGFVVVAAVADVPEDQGSGRAHWPGSGFVVLVAIGIVGLACLIDALRTARSRRRQSQPTIQDKRPGAAARHR